ncbi:hypothetical protein H0H93_014483, partial [Arthromyces matolae]
VDAAFLIDQLNTSIESRLKNNYMSLEFRAAYEQIDNATAKEKREFVNSLKTFHETALTYLNEWTKWLDDIKVFTWITLKNEKLKWEHVESAALWMISRNYFNAKVMGTLFNQFAILERYLDANKDSLEKEESADKKWVHIFCDFKTNSWPYNAISKVVDSVGCE